MMNFKHSKAYSDETVGYEIVIPNISPIVLNKNELIRCLIGKIGCPDNIEDAFIESLMCVNKLLCGPDRVFFAYGDLKGIIVKEGRPISVIASFPQHINECRLSNEITRKDFENICLYKGLLAVSDFITEEVKNISAYLDIENVETLYREFKSISEENSNDEVIRYYKEKLTRLEAIR